MPVEVVGYDSDWPKQFQRLKDWIWPVVSDFALCIEHVGSTSVPGLAAKPVIDMDIIVASEEKIAPIIARLASVEYVHQGDLGVTGREAFRAPEGTPKHHLYLCVAGVGALRNHLAVRDYLRAHPDAAREYGELKKRLAADFAGDIAEYTRRKTDFILAILRKQDVDPEVVAQAERVNRGS